MHGSPADKQQSRAQALNALGRDHRLKLAAWANICGRRAGHGAAGDDVLQSAYERWLNSNVGIGTPDDTVRYLMGAIRSVASNLARDAKTDALGHRVAQEEDVEAEMIDTTTATRAVDEAARLAQSSAFAQALYDQLADDPDLQLLILHLAQDLPRREIQRDLGWDDKKYDAVQKRRTRAAARLIREGKV